MCNTVHWVATGWQVSTVSLGTEYLMDLSREQAVPVIHEALAQGINYFDVFGAAPDFRDNMGVAFTGQRDRALLGAHLGSTYQDGQYEKTCDPRRAEPFFYDFLTRYHTDYVDVLFLHNIDAQADYDRVMQGGMRDLALRLKQEGKARAIGFSGHTVETARQAVESGDVDVLMFPVNLSGNAAPGQARAAHPLRAARRGRCGDEAVCRRQPPQGRAARRTGALSGLCSVPDGRLDGGPRLQRCRAAARGAGLALSDGGGARFLRRAGRVPEICHRTMRLLQPLPALPGAY